MNTAPAPGLAFVSLLFLGVTVHLPLVVEASAATLHKSIAVLTLADRAPIFTDVTVSAGLYTSGFAFGEPIWGDFDNEGDLDLFVDNQWRWPSYLYRNNGNGTFTDIRPDSGINPSGDRHGSGWADFDNDRDLDLSVTKGAIRSVSNFPCNLARDFLQYTCEQPENR
jgi:hypothetical protein